MFRRPSDDPANADFHRLNDPVLASVDRADGLIGRSGYASDMDGSSWGPETYPRFYRDNGDGWSPATLSLWTDLGAVFRFTYSGLHAAALRRGREWFVKPDWPPLVLWWHDGPDNPTWSEGVRRQEHLHDHGPTAEAFTFKEPFDARGMRVSLDKALPHSWRGSAIVRS